MFGRAAAGPRDQGGARRARGLSHRSDFRTRARSHILRNDPWPEVCDTLNSSLSGWSNYFCHGTRRSAFRSVDRYVYERVRDFLARRHKVAGRGTRRFSFDVVYGELGLLRLERLP
jgi:Group II intron, maturase-specific domain